MLESLAAWFTPTTLFLLLNAVIGTIYVTSLFGTNHHKKHHQPPQPHHSPTLFGRVKSINFGLHNEHEYGNTTAQPPPTHDGAPSLLARVKSVNFSDFQFSFFGAENQNRADPEPEPVTVPNLNPVQEPETPALRSRLMARAPSLLKRVKSITFADLPQISIFRPEPGQAADRVEGKTHVRSKSEHEPVTVPNPVQEPETPALRSRLMARAPSLLKRVKSITFADLPQIPIFRPEPAVPEPVRTANRVEGKTHVRSKSASEKMVVERTEVEDVKEVERRRPATARVERTVSINGDVEVDAKADDFINRFKNQLKLQRLNSFVQYTDMITRGSSR